MGNCRSSACLPIWHLLRDHYASAPSAHQQQHPPSPPPQHNGCKPQQQLAPGWDLSPPSSSPSPSPSPPLRPGGGEDVVDPSKQGWRQLEFRLRGRDLSVRLPAGCRAAESGDHRLAAFDASGDGEAAVFSRDVVELVQLEHPELCLFPVLEGRLLVVSLPPAEAGDGGAAGLAGCLAPQLDTAQMRMGMERAWVHSGPASRWVYVYGKGEGSDGVREFCPDLAVTEYARTVAAAETAVVAPSPDALAYQDLPMVLAVEAVGEADDPAAVDRKCRDMVASGAAGTAVGLFLWTGDGGAGGRPRELDGTVRVYTPADPGNGAGGEVDQVQVEELRRPRFVALDRVHPGLRLYLSTLPEYAWPWAGGDRRRLAGDSQALLGCCCDPRDRDAAKEAVNFVGSLNLHDARGRLCAVEAAKAGDVDLLAYAVANGANIDREDGDGICAYLAARAHWHADACAWLEARGAHLVDPHASLDQAIRGGRTKLVDYLLRAGPSARHKAGPGEESSWIPATLSGFLSTAAKLSNLDAVRLLLHAGSKPTDHVLNVKLLLTAVQQQQPAAHAEARATGTTGGATTTQSSCRQTEYWSPAALASCLSTAVKVCNEGAVRMMLDRGCRPCLHDHYVAAAGASADPAIFDLLLERHALSEEDLAALMRHKEEMATCGGGGGG